MKRALSVFCTVLFAVCLALLIRFPQEASAAVAEGLHLCAETLVPALFPYMALSGLLLASDVTLPDGPLQRLTEKLLHLPGSCLSVLLLGFVGGYPTGAKCAAELRRTGQITEREASHLLLFCNNAGPAFFFGVVGGKLLHSAAAGALLYAIHVLSALCIGVLFRGKALPAHSEGRGKETVCTAETIVSAIRDAGQTVLAVCTFVVFFFVLSAPVRRMAKPGSLLSCLVCAFLEVTGGCTAAASSALPQTVRFVLLSAALGWGGVCVHLQTACVTASAGLHMKKYLLAKLLHGVLSGLLAALCAKLLPAAVPAALTDLPLTVQGISPMAFWLPLLIFIFFATGNCRRNPV